MNQNRTFSLFAILLFSFFASNAQGVKMDTSRNDVVQDMRIKELINKKIEVADKTKGRMKGFRVQVYSGVERDKAKEVKSDFLQKYPNVSAYDPYEQPNFKIKVGDFRTKLEAQKFLREISLDFPNAFIVQSEIEMPKVE